MKKQFLTVLVFIAAAIAGFSVFTFFDKREEKKSVESIVPVSADQNLVQVALLSDRAEPDILTVPVNGEVQFNSQDGKEHEIASGAGDGNGQDHEHVSGGAESGKFQPDEAYRLKFLKPGTYTFHDNLNPKISVTVIAY